MGSGGGFCFDSRHRTYDFGLCSEFQNSLDKTAKLTNILFAKRRQFECIELVLSGGEEWWVRY